MKLEGADGKLVNIMVRVGRAKGNWDNLITEALDLLNEVRAEAELQGREDQKRQQARS